MPTPPELLPEVAGSLRDFLLPGASRNEAAAALIRGLRNELPDLVRQRSFLPEYRRRSILLGQSVRVLPVGQEPYEAVAESIDEEAALVVDRQGRKIRLQTGEVSIRFPVKRQIVSDCNLKIYRFFVYNIHFCELAEKWKWKGCRAWSLRDKIAFGFQKERVDSHNV